MSTQQPRRAWTPAQLYALGFGAVLLIAGIIGFAYSASFGSPGEVDAVFGILDVNAWHNIVHIATGALGLLLFRTAAREYALGLGAVYIVVAIWGFIVGDGESILGFIPVNTEDNVLHLLIGLAGLGAGLATQRAVAAPPRGGPAAAH
jgi:Domain of unknown function (DUF4383)